MRPNSATRKRVFLIDDEVEMTQLVGSLLTFNGFDLATANDPEAALNQLLAEDADAVIVDLMMPSLDGFALIERLRASHRHEKTPIVVLSAKTLNDDERKALLSSGVRYVAKPVSPTSLLQIVRDVVRPAQA